jgi:hypothetical protein
MSLPHSALFSESINWGAAGAAGTALAHADPVLFTSDSAGVKMLAAKLRVDEYDVNKRESETPGDYIIRMAAENAPVVSAFCAWTNSVSKKVDGFRKDRQAAGWTDELDRRHIRLDQESFIASEATAGTLGSAIQCLDAEGNPIINSPSSSEDEETVKLEGEPLEDSMDLTTNFSKERWSEVEAASADEASEDLAEALSRTMAAASVGDRLQVDQLQQNLARMQSEASGGSLPAEATGERDGDEWTRAMLPRHDEAMKEEPVSDGIDYTGEDPEALGMK